MDLSFNPLDSFIDYNLIPHLIYLDISYTKIRRLKEKWFKYLKYLKFLKMIRLNIQSIHTNFLVENQLEYFDLSHSKYPNIQSYQIIKFLHRIKNITNEYANLCCYVERYNKKSIQFCSPKNSFFSSCSNLLESVLSKIFLWSYGIIGILSNIFSILFRAFSIKKSFHIFSLSMSIGDFLTGVYLLILGVFDFHYKGSFFENEFYWKNSEVCYFLSFLMNFSLLFSTSNLFLLSFEKYYTISHPFSNMFTKKFAIFAILGCFFICSGISLVLTQNFNVNFFFHFYYKN